VAIVLATAIVNLDQHDQYRRRLMAGWITREKALERLGIRPQSLYAYVSRRRVAAVPDPVDPRRSLYSADDVASLVRRRQRGKSRSAVASASIAWGEPVLETAISTAAHGRLFYRGQDVAALADHVELEDVAELLLGARPVSVEGPAGGGLADAFAWLAGRMDARPSVGRTGASLSTEAGALVAEMARALGALSGHEIHLGFALAWSRPDAADSIRRALVLMADHELNASTFAARVAASTGASLPACVLAGLATLSGPRHGAATTAAAAFAREALGGNTTALVRRRRAEGAPIPGFGHPLYVGMDPRAASLLGALRLPKSLEELRRAVLGETGQDANIDFATAVLAITHDLPDGAPIRLFAAARTTGWLAHSIEQVVGGALIRPRARYVGPAAV
jgi:citrate synthase